MSSTELFLKKVIQNELLKTIKLLIRLTNTYFFNLFILPHKIYVLLQLSNKSINFIAFRFVNKQASEFQHV
jgi:hypothetical protein